MKELAEALTTCGIQYIGSNTFLFMYLFIF